MALPTLTGIGRIISREGVKLEYTSSGQARAKCSIAFSKSHKDDATDKWVTDKEIIFNATAWGPLAEFLAEHANQGDQLNVLGEPEVRKYEKDGQERQSVDLTLRGVDVLPKRAAGTPYSGSGKPFGDNGSNSNPGNDW